MHVLGAARVAEALEEWDFKWGGDPIRLVRNTWFANQLPSISQNVVRPLKFIDLILCRDCALPGT